MIQQQVTLVVPLGPNVPGMSVGEYDGNLAELELALIALFGGFTAVDGRGAWEEGSVVLREDVRVYTLGGNIDADTIVYLRQRVSQLLDQRAVYLATYDLAEKPVQ